MQNAMFGLVCRSSLIVDVSLSRLRLAYRGGTICADSIFVLTGKPLGFNASSTKQGVRDDDNDNGRLMYVVMVLLYARCEGCCSFAH